MKTALKILFCFVFSLAFGLQVTSANATPSTDTVVAFANGIMTTEASAYKSLQRINQIYNKNVTDINLQYTLAYNRTDGFGTDLLQSAEQWAAQDQNNPSSWKALWGRWAGLTWLLHSIAPVRAIDLVLIIWNKIVKPDLASQAFQNDPDLENHLAEYRAFQNLGKGVLIVSHSQGNWYANEAYNRMSSAGMCSAQSMVIASFATPADSVAGGGQYVKVSTDIINTVPGSLASDFQVPNDQQSLYYHADPLSHGFREIYTNDQLGVYNTSVDTLVSSLKAVQQPCIWRMVAGTQADRNGGVIGRDFYGAVAAAACIAKNKSTATASCANSTVAISASSWYVPSQYLHNCNPSAVSTDTAVNGMSSMEYCGVMIDGQEEIIGVAQENLPSYIPNSDNCPSGLLFAETTNGVWSKEGLLYSTCILGVPYTIVP